jgi:L-ascorbate metabolism protein UlaG (beta-lactamase superfamily)
MRITKFTHSCVRLERAGRVLVIDPGVWSEPGALIGADAVLVTHEHVDHIDVLRLAGLGVPVYAPAEARIDTALGRGSIGTGVGGQRPPTPRTGPGLHLTRVSAGETFDAAGFSVRAVGGRHATVVDGSPDCANLGYLVEESAYHPGDALFVPDSPVRTLFVPLQASWLKTAEAIEFVRAVRPEVTIAIHDGQLNERGLSALGGWLAGSAGHGYRWLAPRESLSLP